MAPNIQYDDAASLSFLLSIAVVASVVALVNATLAFCCVDDIPRSNGWGEKNRIERKVFVRRRKRVVAICLLAATCSLAWWMGSVVVAYGDAHFDPFDILGVDVGADRSAVKSAYRRLSLKHHPDREGGDRDAFISVSLAYKALADEKGRQNYRTYGHPDGPQSLSAKMALPSFIASDDNQNIVMIIYLITVVIGVPTFVFVLKSMCSSGESASARSARLRASFVEAVRRARTTQDDGPTLDDAFFCLVDVLSKEIKREINTTTTQWTSAVRAARDIKSRALPPFVEDDDVRRTIARLLWLHMTRTRTTTEAKKRGQENYETDFQRLRRTNQSDALGMVYDETLVRVGRVLRAFIEATLRSNLSHFWACAAIELNQHIQQGISFTPEQSSMQDVSMVQTQRTCAVEQGLVGPVCLDTSDVRVDAYTDGEMKICCGDIITVRIRLSDKKRDECRDSISKRRPLRTFLRFSSSEERSQMTYSERWIIIAKHTKGDEKGRIVGVGMLKSEDEACLIRLKGPRVCCAWQLEIHLKSATFVTPAVIKTLEIEFSDAGIPAKSLLDGTDQTRTSDKETDNASKNVDNDAADVSSKSILEERGQGDLLRAAADDAASETCDRCNAVLPSRRMKQHRELWCDGDGIRQRKKASG